MVTEMVFAIMTPKGHCFFCGDLTEKSIGKIPMCEFCMDELYHGIHKAHVELKGILDLCEGD
jgi:hypothetical protein